MKRGNEITTVLALGALVAVAFAPPEAYGSGRMLLIVTATFAFLTLLADGRIPVRFLAGGCAGWILLVIHSLLVSFDLNRSMEFMELAWAYYCLFGVCRYSDRDLRYPASVTLVALAFAVSVYGLYQFFWGFESLSSFVQNSQASEQAQAPILNILRTERVFSTFALPGTLWGFLILTIPLHAALWHRARSWQRAALVLNLTLVALVAALTQSYGFVLGLVVVVGGWIITRPALRAGPAVLAGMLVTPLAAALVGILYLARAGTHNPVGLRLLNWLSALDIFRAHPLGSGLNTYAVLYLQHQRAGANETQFAHNTPLQLTSELGVFGVVLLLALAIYLVIRRESLLRVEGIRRCLLIALFVWAVHNLMDINVYFGSIGAVGAVLAGLFFRSSGGCDSGPMPAPRLIGTGVGVLAFAVLVLSGMTYVSGELLFRARGELEFQRLRDAAATLATAATINPLDSAILHEAGQVELELYHATKERSHLDASKRLFSEAIRLSPRKVGPRIGLALGLSTENRVEDAIAELKIAEALHPQGTQAPNIRRMIERRRLPEENHNSDRP